MVEFAQDSFAKGTFQRPDLIVENMVKVITRSSLIAVIEKPRFRDFARSLSGMERQILAHGLDGLLHGDERAGFETLLQIMRTEKLAK